MMTCLELACKVKVANSTVFHYIKKLNIKYTYENVNNRRQIVVDDSAIDIIQKAIDEYRNRPKVYKPKVEVPEKKFTIEELRALHPLVKNDKFLITSYFPKDL